MRTNVYKCRECGAELAPGNTQIHFDKHHREDDGCPLWEHGYSEAQPPEAAD